jgi:hypothetical protein
MVSPIISFIVTLINIHGVISMMLTISKLIIANGGYMKCENVKLQMGDYFLKVHMFTIEMGGCDIFLSVEWLRTLIPTTMDFLDL